MKAQCKACHRVEYGESNYLDEVKNHTCIPPYDPSKGLWNPLPHFVPKIYIDSNGVVQTNLKCLPISYKMRIPVLLQCQSVSL